MTPLFDFTATNRAQERARRLQGDTFLFAAAAEGLADRLGAVTRKFSHGLWVGDSVPEMLKPFAARWSLGRFDAAEQLLAAPGAHDLAISLYSLQAINDLPGALAQLRRALNPDGLILAALLGGDTLAELRQALTVAESDMTGGASPRVAPFADVRALGGLLQRAGFALPVVDADALVVRYPDMFALLRDLRAFGGANALVARSRQPARRELFARAAAVYAERFSDPDGRIRATFEILWISGWAPHASQPKPLKPGSAAMRLEDALNLSRQGEPAPDAD